MPIITNVLDTFKKGDKVRATVKGCHPLSGGVQKNITVEGIIESYKLCGTGEYLNWLSCDEVLYRATVLNATRS